MTDELFNISYVLFNLIEALFWITLGIGALIAGRKYGGFRKISQFTFVNLIIFGFSDILEACLGSFFDPGREWLFVLKAFGVIGIVVSIVWYVRIRQLSTPKK